MGAPPGNQFWKLRSKHGRDKLFATPELMKESAEDYFQWCDDNPFLKAEGIKGGDLAGQLMEIPVMRPYTMQGLCSYLGVNTVYFNDFADGLKGKTDQLSKDFSEIIIYIRETIYNQKFSGAASGFLNANIIARDLGLKDQKDMTTNGENINKAPDLSSLKIEDLERLAKELDKGSGTD